MDHQMKDKVGSFDTFGSSAKFSQAAILRRAASASHGRTWPGRHLRPWHRGQTAAVGPKQLTTWAMLGHAGPCWAGP